MRIVCDANVIIAALVADGLCRDLVKRRLPRHEVFSSEALLEELEEKLRDKFGVEADEVPFIAAYRERVVVVKSRPLAKHASRDRDDDEVLATALAARAEVIVTGDKDLLVLKSHEGIPILTPRQLAELLDQQS